MQDIHASIRTFLQQQSVVSLVSQPAPPEGCRKAGVVPYMREGGLRYYVMKPRGDRPELGAPTFQLGKGTRMYLVPGVGWRDLREDNAAAPEKESMAETALREGIEELGLKLSNIAALVDLGPYNFTSAATGKEKQMWLFAAEMKDEDDFAAERDVAITTRERSWVSEAEFAVVGRKDHHYILRDIEAKLKQHHKE